MADGQQTSTVPEGQESTHKNSQEEDRRRSPCSRGQSFAFREDSGHHRGASGATVASILIAESNKKKCVSSSNNKKCTCKKDKKGNEDCEDD